MIQKTKFEDLLREDDLAFVVLGCEEPFFEWESGINNLLIENGVTTDFCPKILSLTTTGGRNDLVFMTPENFDVQKFILWKKAFGLKDIQTEEGVIQKDFIVSLEDYKFKYADHHDFIVGTAEGTS